MPGGYHDCTDKRAYKEGEFVIDTLSRLQDVFQDVFDDDDIEISRNTTAAEIDAWDSLMHVSLMISAEREFDVRFSSTEVAQLLNIGELIELIQAKS